MRVHEAIQIYIIYIVYVYILRYNSMYTIKSLEEQKERTKKKTIKIRSCSYQTEYTNKKKNKKDL